MKSAFRNWSDVRVFLAVMREGSTLAASRRLDIAQPTVARRIDALEHEIGLTLFERDTRGFHPTEVARALLPIAETFEKAAADFEDKAQGLKACRPIRVTANRANLALSSLLPLTNWPKKTKNSPNLLWICRMPPIFRTLSF